MAEPALGLSLEGSYLTGGFRQQPPAHVAGQDGGGYGGGRVWEGWAPSLVSHPGGKASS